MTDEINGAGRATPAIEGRRAERVEKEKIVRDAAARWKEKGHPRPATVRDLVKLAGVPVALGYKQGLEVSAARVIVTEVWGEPKAPKEPKEPSSGTGRVRISAIVLEDIITRLDRIERRINEAEGALQGDILRAVEDLKKLWT